MLNRLANAPLLSLMLILAQSMAGAQDFLVENLTLGRCVADVYSKTYLSDVNKSPVQFSCIYHCMNSQGKVSDVKATHLFYKTTIDAEMGGLTCQGTLITYSQQNGQMRGELTGVEGFWASLAALPEIKKWSIGAGAQVPKPVLEKMRAKMNSDLLEVSTAYKKVSAPFPEFSEAGLVLAEIASGSELGEIYLQNSLARIRIGTSQITKSQYLIDLNISALGRFLL